MIPLYILSIYSKLDFLQWQQHIASLPYGILFPACLNCDPPLVVATSNLISRIINQQQTFAITLDVTAFSKMETMEMLKVTLFGAMTLLFLTQTACFWKS